MNEKVLQIPESHIPELRAIYEAKAKAIIDGVNEYKSKWLELEPILSQLDISLKFPTLNTSSHKQNGKFGTSFKTTTIVTWLDRATQTIKEEGRPLTSVEIIDRVVKNDATVDRAKAENSIPATLSVKASEGKIARTKNDKGEWSYALIEMIQNSIDAKSPFSEAKNS